MTWSPDAKMRAFLISESCVKNARSPYRKVYDDAREKYAEAIHAAPCRRCGPKGTPASVGSPLSKGHQHARAMRMISKELLRDLWLEAKRIHELAGGQRGPETQAPAAPGVQLLGDQQTAGTQIHGVSDKAA